MSETPKYPREVRQAALDLIRKDAALDDSVYTPPGAIGHYVRRHFPPDQGPETAGDREPRNPIIPPAAGAIAIEASLMQ